MSASTREPEQSEEHQQRTRALEERFTHSAWYKRQQMILDLGRRTFLPADWRLSRESAATGGSGLRCGWSNGSPRPACQAGRACRSFSMLCDAQIKRRSLFTAGSPRRAILR
jgi:hypothetical protein